jgi:hypothetical protein
VREDPGPTRPRPAAVVDPELVEAARILRGTLVRVHPSFRFEDRLARRLDVSGERPRPSLLPLPSAPPRPWSLPRLFELGAQVPRGALIGGAIATGVSLAGIALAAWRHRGRAA